MSWLRRLFGSKSARRPVRKVTLMNLQVGDIVTYRLQQFQVVGVLAYNDEGWRWIAYQLEDADGERVWLAVEQDDELEVGFYKRIKLPLNGPPGRTLTYEGKTFYLQEKSDAQITRSEGQAGVPTGAWVDYWEYADDEEEEYLSVEKWANDEYEVSLGRSIDHRQLELLPGSPDQ